MNRKVIIGILTASMSVGTVLVTCDEEKDMDED